VVHIPRHLLIASEAFGPRLDAGRVADALAAGVVRAGRPQPDVCPLAGVEGALRSALDALHFDARMRAARAVVVASASLQERALAGSLTFEIATRARQAGVPAYAVTGADAIDAFDARILDLQLVIEARTPRALAAAGRRLAELA